jgi:hypothetical protein
LTITYLADADKVIAAQRKIDAGHSTMDATTKKTGGVFQSTFGSVMPLAAAAAGAAVLKFGADSISAFHESEAAMAQTNAVLKSTGGEANITATQIVALAQRLRDMSGADDEAIQASENLLLTFTKVRNEAGAGNDIFNQGTEAILDMATAMNNGAIPSLEDLNSRTIQVGKALQDPIKGLTSLGKAGVQFTEQQRDQIEAMVAAGDTMGAQKIILGELETQFGGAAKAAGDTFAGAQAKAQQNIEDLQETIGGILVPLLAELSDKFAELLTDVAPVIEFVGRGMVVAFEAAAEKVEAVIAPIQALLDLLPALNDDVGESSGIWKVWGDAIGGAVEAAVEQVVPGSQAFFELQRATESANEEADTTPSIMDRVASAVSSATDAFIDGTHSLSQNEQAVRHLTDAMRDQRLAQLALTDSYLGIVASSNDVTEAQKELNRLERAGREDTKAYEAAVLDALEAQIGLEDAVLSYGQELADSGETARSVRQKVKDLAADFGIQKGVVSDLLHEIQSYIRDLNRIPEKVDTHVTTFYDKVGTPGRALQHGGIVRRPTVALIGEAGPEAVVPLSKAGAVGASVTVNIGTVVGPGGVAEVADIIRRELVKTGYRNPDIFGGRA